VLPPLQHTASAPTLVLSRLNHAALALPVYASQPRSPSRHARLGSGWWPAFPGRDSFPPQGSIAKFQLMLSWSSSSPRLCLAHMPFSLGTHGKRRRSVGGLRRLRRLSGKCLGPFGRFTPSRPPARLGITTDSPATGARLRPTTRGLGRPRIMGRPLADPGTGLQMLMGPGVPAFGFDGPSASTFWP
jgi:hypothetical protein